jgi:PKD repeat protein
MGLRQWLNLLILVLGCNQAIAQTYKTWQLGRTLHITFSDSVNYQIQSNPLNDIKQYRFFSRPNGSLCIPYASAGETQNTCYVMDNNYSLIQPQPFILGYDYHNYSCLFPTGFDSFTNYFHFRFENYYNCKDFQKNLMSSNPNINVCDFDGKYGLYSKNFIFRNNKPIMTEDIKRILPLHGNVYPPNIRRYKNFDYGGVRVQPLQDQKLGFYSYLIGPNYTQSVDSFLWNPDFLLPPQYKDTAIFKTTYYTNVQAINNDLSPGCNKFICNLQISSNLKAKLDGKTYFAEYIIIINLNQLQFSGIPELIQVDQGETSMIPGDLVGSAPKGDVSQNYSFSPDGQTIYAVLTHKKSNATNNYSSLETYRKVGGKWQRHDSLFSFYRIFSYFINPYGGLTVYAYDRVKNNYRIINFASANNPANPSMRELNPAQGIYSATTHHPYDYLRFDHSLDFKDCGAYLKFTNRCDESFGIDTYEWWIAKNNEQTDFAYFKGRVPPPVFFKDDGVYFVKVHGTNSKDPTGYAEWWWDSIKITIPAKPKAEFSANPLRYCLGSQVAFINTSNQGQINPNKPIDYLWHFGDGDTSTLPFPKHTYKLPGQYDIALEIDNGYCHDTLMLKRYISIVDAPQPGFSLNVTEGCTPFNAVFREKNVRPVIFRKYTLGDGSILMPDTSFFNYSYTKPGRYKIHQLLQSASGCEAKDSADAIVHRGFTEADSSHIFISTYTNNQNIKLSWLAVPDAHSYNIYGGVLTSDKLLATLPASVLSYTAEIPEPAPYSFNVIALDSCQKESKVGRSGIPIFLNYTQDENRSVTLNYTAYKQWEVPIIKYEIYTLPVWSSPIKDNGMALNYLDHEFAKTPNGLEDTMRCYAIKAAGLDGRESWSNQVCAKRQPAVFLPTAFTPDANGLNDIYLPAVIGMRSYELSIYNRWGQRVSQTYNAGWKPDGISTGVYVAVFIGTDINGRTIHLHQTIHLLR